jgi:hypothetical protein
LPPTTITTPVNHPQSIKVKEVCLVPLNLDAPPSVLLLSSLSEHEVPLVLVTQRTT